MNMIEIIKTILDEDISSESCCFCFKRSDRLSDIYENYEVIDENGSYTFTILDAINKMTLFDLSEAVSECICEECSTLILQVYIKLRKRQHTKQYMLQIVNILSKQIDDKYDNNTSLDGIFNLYIPKIVNINDKGQDEINYLNFELSNVAETNETKLKSDNLCHKCGKEFETYHKLNIKSKKTKCPCTKRENQKKYIKCTKYSCNNCSFSSKNKYTLEAHIHKVHLNIRPYTCEICDKGFYKKSNLVEHKSSLAHLKKSNSLRQENNTCEVCGINFVNRKCLRDHLRGHYNEKPYQCEKCELKFVSASRRSDHVRRKHNEKTETCDICGKVFNVKSVLNRHIKNVHGRSVQHIKEQHVPLLI